MDKVNQSYYVAPSVDIIEVEMSDLIASSGSGDLDGFDYGGGIF